MNPASFRRTIACSLAIVTPLLLALPAQASTESRTTFYSTKTPYQPKQDMATYEKAPAGFSPIFMQGVWRHGSRGLTSPKYDLAVYNMWEQAKKDGALTEHALTLGDDLKRLTRANALLGYGVEGVSKPGYGNLTKMGLAEHADMAKRTVKRMAPLFTQAASDKAPRKILHIDSGNGRSVDSGLSYVRTLVKQVPGLEKLVVRPPAPGPKAKKPGAKPDGSNRYLGYFQGLKPELDEITDPKDPWYSAYQTGAEYVKYVKSKDFKAAQKSVTTSPWAVKAARDALLYLFKPEFVAKIENGTYKFANTGGGTFTSDDGKFTNTIKGKGKDKIEDIVEAAGQIYELYIISPSMKSEAGVDFRQYINDDVASRLEMTTVGENFFKQGPGTIESNRISIRIAQPLLDHFFAQMDNIAKGDLTYAASVVFGHAETIIPFAAILGIKDTFEPLPLGVPYTHVTSKWRGPYVSPMAANVQWDAFVNKDKKLIVRMLFNEKETDFKVECDSAKIKPKSKFYDYAKLRTCYGVK